MRNTAIFLCLCACMLLTACGKKEEAVTPSEPVMNSEASGQNEAAGSTEAEITVGRQNGERFEDVIILEGMEETVRYEHVRNDALGFEMDYDYESFVRKQEMDRECFISIYDDPNHPENYLEVTYSPGDAGTVADSISEKLSNEYEISRDDSFQLDHSGRCIRIDASAEKGGLRMPERLQMVYVIPAADGCRVATAHYTIESAEGFGRRFHYLMNTFEASDRNQ